MEAQKKIRDLDARAEHLVEESVRRITASPKDYAEHAQALYDLKKELVALCAVDSTAPAAASEDLAWELSRHMPDFSTGVLYQKRASLWALGGAVFTGWLLGGLLSTVLGWLGMGGDILRVFTIWGMLYASEYLSSHPRARTRLLTLLGLGGLTAFVASLLAGVLSLTSWGAIKRAVFGGDGQGTGLLRRCYLLLGAAFLFVFLSKKVTALDVPAFTGDLQKQVRERLHWLRVFRGEVERRDAELAALQNGAAPHADSEKCPKNNCPLALDLMGMLSALDPDARKFLTARLAAVGYEVAAGTGEPLVWNAAEHEKLYTMIGLVRDGDRCRILKPAIVTEGKIIRGYVQRDAGSGS